MQVQILSFTYRPYTHTALYRIPQMENKDGKYYYYSSFLICFLMMFKHLFFSAVCVNIHCKRAERAYPCKIWLSLTVIVGIQLAH